MRNKTKRLLTIRKLIESELISSQEELLFRLKEMNVEATKHFIPGLEIYESCQNPA